MCKICTRCNKEFCGNVEKHFYPRSISKDGYQSTCRYCLLDKKHKITHINEVGELLCLHCEYYKPEEEFDINTDIWFRKNRDRRCKDCKKRQNEKRRIQNRGDGSINRLLLERYHGLKDRARAKGLVVEFDKDYLKYLWDRQRGLCAISNIQMTYTIFSGRVSTNVSVDRIDSAIGYTKENVQLVCMAVNQMKNDLSQEELLFFCNKIVENEKENNNR